MFIEVCESRKGMMLLNINNIIYINEDVANNRVIISMVDDLIIIEDESYEQIIKRLEDAI